MTITTVAQLMTADPLCVTREASLKDAHDLMRGKNIRHIPVIDTKGELVGMLTQKIMIAKVMGLMAQYGATALERKEKHIVRVKTRLPVYFRYFTAAGKNGKLFFFDDIYHEDKMAREAYFSTK